MEKIGKVNLTEEKETLFITLYAKALDYRSKHSILHDKVADDLVQSIDYDFSKYDVMGSSIMVVRARQFDEWIREFIQLNPNAIVVHLGCGMDTRVHRIELPATVSWFDVDYPEVIQLRKFFFKETDQYIMIESSITDIAWLQQIPTNRSAIIVAEGVLEYVEPREVKLLLNRLTDHFMQGQVIFDVMNSFAIQSGKQRLTETTGASHKWAVDDIAAVDRLNPSLKRITELSVFKSPYLKKLSVSSRLLFFLLSFFARFRNMLRLLRYQL